MENVLEIENICFNYGSEKVLKDISFEVKKGEYVAIVGDNGSGKSTLIKLILGLDKPLSGSIKIFQKKLSSFKNWYKIGYIPQQAMQAFSDSPISVYEFILFAFDKKSELNFKERLEEISQLLNIKNILYKPLKSLSGGQKQKVFIARSLINKPQILILDEPVAAVDIESKTGFYDFLKQINLTQKITIIQITHDLDSIRNQVGRILCVQQNSLHENDLKIEHIHSH
jgi:zinc transport system ATP-binding protein